MRDVRGGAGSTKRERGVTLLLGTGAAAGSAMSPVHGSGAVGLVTAAVLLAAVLHAIWNALAHQVADKLVTATLLSLSFVVFGVAALPWVEMPAAASWPALAASAAVHLAYTLLLMRSYRLGAFNQMYPLARGMAPWLVALVAMTLVGERLSGLQLLGVAVVSLGLGCLVFANGVPRHQELPAVSAAALTGLSIAAYTVIDGVGVRLSGAPLGYAAWLFILHGLSMVAFTAIRRGPSLWPEVAAHWRLGAVAGTCAVLAYGLVLWAQSRGSLAAVAALRETSVIVGAVIGAVVFREPFGRWRTAATVVVVAGIALLNLG
jgi:drug/metabolite transporter (DMT)-like permease